MPILKNGKLTGTYALPSIILPDFLDE